MSPIPPKLVAASSAPLVLSILAKGESYGYAILKQVRDLSDGELEWTEGMLYPVLHRLEEQGAIRARWRSADTGRRRRYYALTAAGRKALVVERERWMTVHNALNQLWEADPCTG